jgi:hypothetical protein
VLHGIQLELVAKGFQTKQEQNLSSRLHATLCSHIKVVRTGKYIYIDNDFNIICATIVDGFEHVFEQRCIEDPQGIEAVLIAAMT